MQGAGGGVHELFRERVGVDPTHLSVLARLAVLGFPGPVVGDEDDCQEAIGGFDAPGAVDDVGDAEVFRPYGDAGLLVQFADRRGGDGLAGVAFADGEVPFALGELGVGASLEEQDAVGGLVMDDDGGDEQRHGVQGGREGVGLVGPRVGHGAVPFVRRWWS